MAYFKETRFKDFAQSVKMDKKEKEQYIDQIKQDLKKNPTTHLNKEWGVFEGLRGLTDSEIDKKAKEILSKMTLKQKINQMSGDSSLDEIVLGLGLKYNESPYYAGEDKELGIPAIKFSDGPNGCVMYHSTAFPVSMARASTFNTELETKVGDAIGKEVRAQGGNYYGGVCINLVRHPAWGRCQETYGEDPTLLGEMGYSLVNGVQKHVMACVKHFATNSIENTRFQVNVDIDERSLREVYLPHFKRSIIDGKAASVMAAYNYMRGKPCGENEYLLKKILKDEWGFKGFVLSDFIFCIRHTSDAANNGMDVEMPTTIYWGNRLLKAVENGEVSEDNINESVLRILREKIRFAGVGEKHYGKDMVCCGKHIELARKTAEESFVLLKNKNNMLPLSKEDPGKIAVIGKLAIEANIGGGLGSCAVRPPYIVTPLEGIRNKVKSAHIVYNDGLDIVSAAKDAALADKVIIVTGLTCNDEGECMNSFVDDESAETIEGCGGDRADLHIHDHDVKLIEACAAANSQTAVCLTGGSAIIMSPWNDKVAAILMIWYPGMEGGTALANVLFGDVNPSGKLPITIPDDPSQLPKFEINAVHTNYGYYHGYFLADKEHYNVEYPFGFGLSYTTFKYDNLRLSKMSAKPGETISAFVDIKNTGNMAGKEAVQLYSGYVNPSVERHVKDLRAFIKVELMPGETKTVEIKLPIDSLAYYNIDEKKFVVDPIEYDIMVGPSSESDKLLSIALKVIG